MNAASLFLFSLLVQQPPPILPPGSAQKEATQPHTNTQNKIPTSGQNASGLSNLESQNASGNEQQQRDAAYDRRLNHIYQWATVVGVIGGWVVLAVIWRQTNHLINGERAWVMVEVDWDDALRRVLGYQDTSMKIRFTYTNEGKTIAWIDEKLACLQIVHELPKKPDIRCLEMIDPEPEWASTTGGGQLSHFFTVPTIEGPGDISVIWGVIKYRDAFRGKHKTVFGFRITPDNRFERLAGLTEYNKNT
jgi:YD repeat-containing protein